MMTDTNALERLAERLEGARRKAVALEKMFDMKGANKTTMNRLVDLCWEARFVIEAQAAALRAAETRAVEAQAAHLTQKMMRAVAEDRLAALERAADDMAQALEACDETFRDLGWHSKWERTTQVIAAYRAAKEGK